MCCSCPDAAGSSSITYCNITCVPSYLLYKGTVRQPSGCSWHPLGCRPCFVLCRGPRARGWGRRMQEPLSHTHTHTHTHSLTRAEVIGQGGGGVVYKGFWRGLMVAVKTLVFTVLPQQPMSRRQQRAMTEAAICRTLQHPNIVVRDLSPPLCVYVCDVQARWLRLQSAGLYSTQTSWCVVCVHDSNYCPLPLRRQHTLAAVRRCTRPHVLPTNTHTRAHACMHTHVQATYGYDLQQMPHHPMYTPHQHTHTLTHTHTHTCAGYLCLRPAAAAHVPPQQVGGQRRVPEQQQWERGEPPAYQREPSVHKR